MRSLNGVFRREWGPAVAALARWSGDLGVAEDAVQ
jgi:RNA polymerase sigma-70 factor (ECF subfamily)